MTEKEFLNKFRGTPEAQRLLQTIRFAEGTAGPKGYQTMFGGGTFSDFKRHPNRVINTGGYSSAAAGAYQFLPGSWQSHATALGLKDFSPANQDIAALRAARNRLMPIGGLSVLQKEGFSPRVSAALAPEWASFPTESGRSYYGQPVKPLAQLQKIYGSTQVAPQPQRQVAAAAPAAPPKPVSSVLSSILGVDLSGSEEKKSLSQMFVQNAIQSLLPGMGVIPGLFGTTGVR